MATPTDTETVPETLEEEGPAPEVPIYVPPKEIVEPPETAYKDLDILGLAHSLRGVTNPASQDMRIWAHAESLGMTRKDLDKAFAQQGFNPAKLLDAVGTKGQEPSEYLDALRATKEGSVVGTEQERKVKARGEMVRIVGYERAKRGIGRTIQETGVIPEELLPKEALESAGRLVFTEDEKAGFFGTDVEDAPEIVKEGSQTYDNSRAINQFLEASDDKQIKRMIHMRDAYKDLEKGAENYIDERTLDILTAKGFEENVTDPRVWESEKERAALRAAKEIALWKTIGVWQSPTFVRWSALKGDKEELTWSEAFKPTMEVVGLNAKNEVVVRTQGGLQWGLELSDILQSAFTGVLMEDDATIGQRALQGVAKRRNLMEAALESDMAAGGTAGKIAAGGAGFLAAVIFPDLTFGAAGLTRQVGKQATKRGLLGSARKVAQHQEDAAKLFIEALASGDPKKLREAARASGEARKLAPISMDRVDTNDFNVARRLAKDNPDILGRPGKELAEQLPGEAGELAVNLHPSQRKRYAKKGGPDAPQADEFAEVPKIAYEELYDFARHFDLINDGKRLVEAKDFAVYTKWVKRATTEGGTAFLKAAKKLEGLDSFDDIVETLRDFRKMATNGSDWADGVKARVASALNEAVGAKQLTKAQATKLQKKLDKITSEMADASDAAVESAGSFDDIGKALARADEAVKTNIEARAVALAFERELLLGELGLKPQPIIAKATTRVRELRELSEEAIRFMDDAMDVFGASKDQALEVARIMDLAAQAAERKPGGVSPARWWQQHYAGMGDKAAFMERLGITRKGTWHQTIRHVAAQAETALPEGYRLVGVGDEAIEAVGDLGPIQDRFLAVAQELGELSEDQYKTLSRLWVSGASPSGNYAFVEEAGALAFNQKAFDAIINSEVFKGEPKLVKLLDDMIEDKMFVKSPPQWKVINDAGEVIVDVGDDVLDVVEAAVKKLIDEKVIVRSDLDKEIGHPIRVGPIIYGMSIDAVDAAIGGGYRFEWGGAWVDGKMVFRKKGKRTQVPFTQTERAVISRTDNVSFTHNHPDFSWFSTGRGDMGFAAVYDIRDFRVVWPDGTMIKVEVPNGWGDIALHSNAVRGLPTDHAKMLRWRTGLGSYVSGPSRKVANRARYEAIAAGKAFSDRDYAVAYTTEANRRLVELGRELGIDLRISVRQPNEGIEVGLRTARPTSEGLTGKVAREAAEAKDADVLLQQMVPKQTGWEMQELGEGLVELASKEIREGGGGLTFKVEGNTLQVQATELPEALRGQGLGQEMYLRALEHAKSIGKGFSSDIAPSPDAIAAYERLIERGVPLTRKTVEAADGKMVQQFVATADDLADASLDVAPRGGRVVETATDTPEFRRWSGGAPVIRAGDEIPDGPVVLETFHGTRRDFDAFRPSEKGRMGKGIYLTNDPKLASRFAGTVIGEEGPGRAASVLPVYVRLDSVMDMRAAVTPEGKAKWIDAINMNGGDGIKFFEKLEKSKGTKLTYRDVYNASGARKGQSISDVWGQNGLYTDPALAQDIARSAGFDSAIVGRGREIVAFDPTQIKSKFNRGTFDPDDPRILKQEIDDTAKGAVEFLDDGRAFIYALENPDFSTLVHEVGHILRRDLDPEDLGEVHKWVRQLGADVEFEAGRFVGDAAEVRKAEEFFAEAFENYIKTGEAPSPGLKAAFQRMKAWMVEIYRTVGPAAKPSPTVTKIFDKMLAESAPTESSMPRILKLIKRELLGPTDAPKLDVIKTMAADAYRLGVKNADYETLLKQLDTEGKITLESGIMADRFGKGGKKEFTSQDLVALRSEMENEITEAAASYRPNVATTAYAQAVREMRPSDRIEQLLRGSGGKMRARQMVKSTFMGGDVIAERGMQDLAPAVRKNVDTASRVVEQGNGEVIRLVAEAESPEGYDKLIRYLVGENVNYLVGGRSVLTSGHNSVKSVMHNLGVHFGDGLVAADALDDLVHLSNHIAKGGRLEDIGFASKLVKRGGQEMTQARAVERAWNELFREKTGPVFVNDLLVAVSPKVAAGGTATPKEYKLTEILMYYTRRSERKGEYFTGTSRELTEGLLEDLGKEFGRDAAMRAAVLIGTHGHADRARMLWSGLGLAIDKDTMSYFKRWIMGEDIPTKYVPKVKKLVERFGLNPNFVEDSLLGTSFYVPAAARSRIADAIARGTDPEQINRLMKSEQNIKGITGTVLRYMKLRMTRGGVAVRQRYFLMNTIDNFVQMAMMNGLLPALGSAARVVAQDVMVLPGVARTIDVLQRGGVLEPRAAERLRKSLQKYGDKVGRFFSGAKYNVNVNPILEGAEGTFRVGGNVYSYKEIRDIAVQEGIFSSFDTSQLSNAVKRAGAALDADVARQTTGAAAKRQGRKVAEFMTQVVTDTAEAWSERERLGGMVTLMELGVPARQAARMTIDSLFDYAGTMSKMDRAWFVSMALPFWAFQKNANRMIIDSMFSPWGAYRMGVLRRSQERGAELMTTLLYDSVADEYGVDYGSLPEDGPGSKGDYMNFRRVIEDHYGGHDKVPKEAKRAIRMWIRGNSRMVESGKFYELDSLLMSHTEGEASPFRGYVQPPPSKAGRPAYLRDRAGITIPYPMREATRKYYNAVFLKKDHPYTEIFIPDSTINAGFRHITNMAAFYILAADQIGLDAGMLSDVDDGSIEVDAMEPLRHVVDLERAPFIGDVMKAYTGKEGFPKRVHPWLVPIVEQTFTTEMLRVPAKKDMFETPAGPESIEFEQERVYMFPGKWSIAFDNSPLGELNTMLNQQFRPTDKPPFIEPAMSSLEATSKRGRLVAWARAITGAQTTEVSGARTAQREEPKRLTTTTRPK